MASIAAVWTIAHQGGWDELLTFGVPIVLAVVAVRWAERRGKQRRAEHAHHHPAPSPADENDRDHDAP